MKITEHRDDLKGETVITVTVTDEYISNLERLPYEVRSMIDQEQKYAIIKDSILMANGFKELRGGENV